MTNAKIEEENPKKYAIRFGIGAIKAVGFNMIEEALKERENNGKFKDIYDFSQRVDPKSINKKSIEALAKSGSFDSLNINRRQISESFDVLSAYANEAKEEANSNQMNLFGGITEEGSRPPLKSVVDWNKKQKLNCEFEAFGFFLNEHPIDNRVSDLKLRGVIFSPKIEEDLLEDNTMIKMAGVVASSKHRSGPRGRFAYLNISDPFGIYEATIFDEALITANRDLLEDGSEIVVECLIRKDDGGTRIMVKGVFRVDDFIKDTNPSPKEFEDIKKIAVRKFNPNYQKNSNFKNEAPKASNQTNSLEKKSSSENIETVKIERKISQVEIKVNDEKALLPLRTVLSQKISNNIEDAKIILIANRDNQEVKIALASNFKIAEIDIFRLKNLHKDLIIKSII
jgi:DNA polymerase III alpha subunit